VTLSGPTATAPTVSEKGFQAAVVQLAKLQGWMAYHTHDSRRSEPGFPDCVLARAPRLILAELKRETGQLTEEQQAWLDELAGCGSVEVYVWRPADWPEIERTLRRPA
jgi:hypothetical protein